jgi:hypothetical protein
MRRRADPPSITVLNLPPLPRSLLSSQPLADRVLIKVEDVADVTMGGVVLPETAKERPQR